MRNVKKLTNDLATLNLQLGRINDKQDLIMEKAELIRTLNYAKCELERRLSTDPSVENDTAKLQLALRSATRCIANANEESENLRKRNGDLLKQVNNLKTDLQSSRDTNAGLKQENQNLFATNSYLAEEVERLRADNRRQRSRQEDDEAMDEDKKSTTSGYAENIKKRLETEVKEKAEKHGEAFNAYNRGVGAIAAVQTTLADLHAAHIRLHEFKGLLAERLELRTNPLTAIPLGTTERRKLVEVENRIASFVENTEKRRPYEQESEYLKHIGFTR